MARRRAQPHPIQIETRNRLECLDEGAYNRSPGVDPRFRDLGRMLNKLEGTECVELTWETMKDRDEHGGHYYLDFARRHGYRIRRDKLRPLAILFRGPNALEIIVPPDNED